MYDLVDALTYKLRAISPNMWPVFELTYKLFKHDAIDFLEGLSSIYSTLFSLTIRRTFSEMLPSLDNFVSYGADVIKARPNYKQMLVDIYTTSITTEQLGENDRVNGSKLAESLLLNLRGGIDDVRISSSRTKRNLTNSFTPTVPPTHHHHCSQPPRQYRDGRTSPC